MYLAIGSGDTAPTDNTDNRFSSTIPQKTNAGTYSVYYFAAESDNYFASEMCATPVSVEIKKKKLDTPNAPTVNTSLTYTGSDIALLTAEPTLTNASMQYVFGATQGATPSFDSPLALADVKKKPAGTYYVWYRACPTDTTNYAPSDATELTIAITPSSEILPGCS